MGDYGPLSESEVQRARYHLGYSLSTTLFYIPADAGQVEAAARNLRPGSEALIRDLLSRLDATDARIAGAERRLSVAQVGDVVLRQNELPELRTSYAAWASRLAAALNIALKGRDDAGVSGTRRR